MGMEPQPGHYLPIEHEVRHDGGGVVIVINVIGIVKKSVTGLVQRLKR